VATYTCTRSLDLSDSTYLLNTTNDYVAEDKEATVQYLQYQF